MKKKKIKISKVLALLVIAAILVISVKGIIYASSETVDVVCNDQWLYEKLVEELKSSYIHSKDVSTKTITIYADRIPLIETLDLSDQKEITDLKGIEVFSNLKNLNLSNNNISNISVLSSLSNLTSLNISSNSVSDLTPISNLGNITQLNVSNNSISNLTPIAKLTKMLDLNVANNSISDIKVVQNFQGMEKLSIASNKSITSLDDLLVSSLISLDISNTGITKIKKNDNDEFAKIVLRCTELKELILSNNAISDLSNLFVTQEVEEGEETKTVARLRNLEKLNLSYPKTETYVSFGTLSIFENLKELYLQGNNLTDVYGIYELSSLQYVNLENNNITDLSGVRLIEEDENGVPRLKKVLNASQIIMKNNQIEDISPLGDLPNITYLDLANNKINYIAPIEKFKLNSNTLFLQDQDINMSIYKKSNHQKQYIILLDIMQRVKNKQSVIYDEKVTYQLTDNISMNTNEVYNQVPYYNVIIDTDKYLEENENNGENEPAEISVTLKGGIADGTKIKFHIAEDSYSSIDSILFNDENLEKGIYNYLISNKSSDYVYLVRAPKILNITRSEIENTQTLNLANNNIKDLQGLSNFMRIRNLNLSNNSISNDSEISYMPDIEVLNLANNQLNNKYTSIENMKNLRELDLSANGIKDLNSLQKLLENIAEDNRESNFTDITLKNNEISNIDILAQIPTLISLDISNNKVSDIEKLSENKNLKILNISNNLIEDISIIKDLTKLTTLSLANNKVKDISPAFNLSLNVLNASGNKISDITGINRLRSLTNLDLSQNRIADIAQIENLLVKDSLKFEQQKVSKQVEEPKEGTETIEVDLPEIVKSAKKESSKAYTTEEYTLNNCELSEDGTKILVDASKLGTQSTSIVVNGGKADKTAFSVTKAVSAKISYSTEELTNQDVTATITFNRAGVKITNNDGNDKYVFKENGEFEFTYEDENETEYSEKAIVTWIDKVAPVLDVKYSETKPTKEKVTVTITSNEEIGSFEGEDWKLSEDKLKLVKEYAENTEKPETVVVKDVVSNATSVNIEIKNIDKNLTDATPADVNEDGKVDTTDTLKVLRHIAASKDEKIAKEHPDWVLTDKNLQNADINKDGKIDTTDTLKILRHIAASKDEKIAKEHPDWIIK